MWVSAGVAEGLGSVRIAGAFRIISRSHLNWIWLEELNQVRPGITPMTLGGEVTHRSWRGESVLHQPSLTCYLGENGAEWHQSPPGGVTRQHLRNWVVFAIVVVVVCVTKWCWHCFVFWGLFHRGMLQCDSVLLRWLCVLEFTTALMIFSFRVTKKGMQKAVLNTEIATESSCLVTITDQR